MRVFFLCTSKRWFFFGGLTITQIPPTGGSLPFPATHMVGETQSDTTMHGSARLGDTCTLHIITKSKKRQKSKMKKKQKKKQKKKKVRRKFNFNLAVLGMICRTKFFKLWSMAVGGIRSIYSGLMISRVIHTYVADF